MKQTGMIGGPHLVKITDTDGMPYRPERGGIAPIRRYSYGPLILFLSADNFFQNTR